MKTRPSPAPMPKGAKPARKPRAPKTPTVKRAEKTSTEASRAPAPTVGRVVHMYDHALPEGGHGGKEHGPYAAIVTAVRPAGKAVRHDPTDHSVSEIDVPEMVDLWVMPPASAAYERGGVPFQAEPHPHVAGAAPEFARYWTWPPRA
jgi:hypothetical protein